MLFFNYRPHCFYWYLLPVFTLVVSAISGILSFSSGEKGKIINIDDCQLADSPGDNSHIEVIKLDMQFQDFLASAFQYWYFFQ